MGQLVSLITINGGALLFDVDGLLDFTLCHSCSLLRILILFLDTECPVAKQCTSTGGHLHQTLQGPTMNRDQGYQLPPPQTCQVSRITCESHGFWQFLKAHGRETQCSRIFVNLTECCDQGIQFFCTRTTL